LRGLGGLQNAAGGGIVSAAWGDAPKPLAVTPIVRAKPDQAATPAPRRHPFQMTPNVCTVRQQHFHFLGAVKRADGACPPVTPRTGAWPGESGLLAPAAPGRLPAQWVLCSPASAALHHWAVAFASADMWRPFYTATCLQRGMAPGKHGWGARSAQNCNRNRNRNRSHAGRLQRLP
jgi:hypothetical protein